jgi:hypothetical protein
LVAIEEEGCFVTIRWVGLSLVAASILLCFGCETETAVLPDSQGDTVKILGTVVLVELEGPFYGIQGDHGARYEPVNLPPEFQVDGLRVAALAVELRGAASIHMWGRIVRLLAIGREADLPFAPAVPVGGSGAAAPGGVLESPTI